MLPEKQTKILNSSKCIPVAYIQCIPVAYLKSPQINPLGIPFASQMYPELILLPRRLNATKKRNIESERALEPVVNYMKKITREVVHKRGGLILKSFVFLEAG